MKIQKFKERLKTISYYVVNYGFTMDDWYYKDIMDNIDDLIKEHEKSNYGKDLKKLKEIVRPIVNPEDYYNSIGKVLTTILDIYHSIPECA